MRHGLLFCVLFALVGLSRTASAVETVKVLVPDKENLQYATFWVADGAGFFADEGIAIELLTPPAMAQAEGFFEEHKADVAVLPPPMYANLIARDVPVVLVANLFANDPIELVVRRSILEERKLSADMPLRARLEGLRGLKLGIAPHPPTRLRALYSSVGLDPEKDITSVILHGKEQNAAFHEGEVDALYAHTPYVERAILHDDAVVLVNQSAGEVPGLANRQIHSLAVRRSFLELHEPLVAAMVRAIAKAETLAHRTPDRIAPSLAKVFPARDRAEIDLIAKLYAPAIPETPTVRAELIPNAVELFPAGKQRPDLAKVDLSAHVANVVPAAPSGSTSFSLFNVLAAIAGCVVFGAGGAYLRVRMMKTKTSTNPNG